MARYERRLAKQRVHESRLQTEINASKSRPMQASGNVPSQWGQVVDNEQRLIDCSHFMKSDKRAKQDYDREVIRKLKMDVKALTNKMHKQILVKRKDGITIQVIEKEW